MLVVIILGLLSMFFAWLESAGLFKHGLKVSFGLIFIFLALRYNFGNDYKGYLERFLELNRNLTVDIFDKNNHFEPGWLFLCWSFKSLGFFAMTAVLAALNCLIYYRFIKKYAPKKFYWLAIFIYIFNPEFLLIHSSAMRQSLAIGLFIFSIDYIYKKNFIIYCLCIGLASFFHSSALILLPVYLFGYLNLKIKIVAGIIIVSVFFSIFIFDNVISQYLDQFISENFDKYENHPGAGTTSTGLGVVYFFVLFLSVVYYERFQNRDTAILFKIAIVSFMFIPLYLIIQSIGRVGMYFTPAIIIAYPIILNHLYNPIYKRTYKSYHKRIQIPFQKHILYPIHNSNQAPYYAPIFFALLLIVTTYQFFQFFSSVVWRDAFGTYYSIFSAPMIY